MKLKKVISLLLLVAVGLQLGGCAGETVAEPVNQTVIGEPVNQKTEPDTQPAIVEPVNRETEFADFSLALLQNTYDGGDNCILSPYSILSALAMTVNGAQGETLTQMEQALGMDRQTLNALLAFCEQEKGQELATANSLWLRDDVEAKEAFLTAVDNYFKAEVYSRPFNGDTVGEINGWVNDHTAGRIPSIVDSLNPSDLMVLVNALTFDAKWASPFESGETFEGVFHAGDGREQRVDMMHGMETVYLENEKATGFLKDYEGGQYAYLALLPREDDSMADYLASLTGSELVSLLDNASQERVRIAMPRYQLEQFVKLEQALQAMGMTDAFTDSADFTDLSDEPLCISRVLHKTYLKVDEEGTEAAAATAVIVEKAAAMPDYKEVVLDRPFVMGIVDKTTGALIFLGVVNTIG